MYAVAPEPLDHDTAFCGTWVGRLLMESPARVIDVGARDGFHPIFRQLGRLCSVLGFEPDADGYAALCEDEGHAGSFHEVRVEPLAVGAGGTQRFYTYAAPTNNSLLPQNDAVTRRYNIVAMEPRSSFEIETHRLDNIVFDPEKDLAGFGEFIKLDTQGSEYEILENATRMLTRNTVAVVSEVWFCEVYRRQPLFHHLCALMEREGFQFYGFLDFFLRSGKRLDKRASVGRERALYADAVFLRDPLATEPSLPVDEQGRRQIALLIAFAIATRFFDFALELADRFGGEDRNALADAVRACARADVAAARRDLGLTCDEVARDAGNAMVAMGRFADRWRTGFDYADVA